MRRWRLAALAVAVIGLAAGALIATGLIGGPAPTVPTIKIEETPFRVRVTAEGNLAAVNNTQLTAPMKPHMPFTLSWIVDDGSLVSEGDVVARFDASQLEKDHDDGLTDQRISDHKISSAETDREVNLGKLEIDVDVAAHELEVAKEFQSTDTMVYSKMEIVEAQIDTELAETRAGHARESQDIQDQLSEAEVELLTIDRRKADIKVSQAEEGLAALEVRSPHEGLVILERDWRGNPKRVGDAIWPGRALAKIPDLSEMQAEVFVLEADAGDLADGQSATVWLEASPELGYAAIVEKIDPMAGRRNRRVPVQYFRTVLALEHTDTLTMKPGARVRSEIIIADLDSAITVPRQSVCSVDGSPVVYRWTRRGFEVREVELGPAAMGRVVISSGLKSGDVIALRDPSDEDSGSPAETGVSSSPVLPGGGL